jgi:hypothetical protein
MKLKLSPPWCEFAAELEELLRQDEEINVIFDQEAMEIAIYVDNQAKAAALTQLLPVEKEFGAVKLAIKVIPSNGAKVGDMYEDQYKTAFLGNPRFSGTYSVDIPLGHFTYIIWQFGLVQFFADNLADYHGNRTMVVADVANDVLLPRMGVFHCSENARIGESKTWG